MMTSLQGNLRV
jgi:hypothetical protein